MEQHPPTKKYSRIPSLFFFSFFQNGQASFTNSNFSTFTMRKWKFGKGAKREEKKYKKEGGGPKKNIF